jgi:ATP-dependent protease ClpP protease subunit
MSLKNRDRVSKGYIVDEMHRFNILLESREIFLHAYIDNVEDDPGVEYRMANNFLKNIKLLEHMDSKKPIIVHQHSVGGSWTEGMMVYDAIQTCLAPVIIITHGIAASMGSIVPQSADLRVTMPNCWWLIHDGYSDISGLVRRQAKAWHDWENKLEEQMMDIYLNVCSESELFKNKKPSQIKYFIKKKLERNEDWWLSGEESLNYGFSDAVYGSKGYENLEEVKKHVY